MKRAALALGCLAVLASPAAGAEPAPCNARVEVAPREALVGQAIQYYVHIEQSRDVRRVRFEPALRFPAFRNEWLPTRSLPDPKPGWRSYVERRVLHAAHAGELSIPEAGVICESTAGSQIVELPVMTVAVREPPLEGRPENWTGVVGPIELSQNLTPRRVALGKSVRLSVRVAGPGNVWQADPGMADAVAELPLDLFPQPPTLERDAGSTLEIRQYRVYDLVPREVGYLKLPELEFPFFDPETASYRVATLPPMVIEVRERAPTPVASPQTPARARDPVPERALPVGWLLSLALGLLAVGAVIWLRRRPVDPWPAVVQLLRDGQLELDSNQLDQAASTFTRALLTALRIQHPDAGPSSEDVLRQARGDATTQDWVVLIERFERARFASAPDAAEIRAAAGETSARLREPPETAS